MPTTKIQGVQFSGSDRDLHELIGCWNAIKGVRWQVAASDFVGGSFNVTFSRPVGRIGKAEAQGWVDSALLHANE